jgi:hypothetical protein
VSCPRSAFAGKSGRLGLALGLIAWAAVAICWSSSASAANYTVEICTPSSSVGDGLTYEEHTPGSLFLNPCGSVAAGTIAIGSPLGGTESTGASRAWRLTAPEGTRIEGVQFSAPTSRSNPGDPELPSSTLEWHLLVENIVVERQREDGRPQFPENLGRPLGSQSHSVAAGLFCVDEGHCGLGGSLEVKVENLVAHMSDEFFPGFKDVTLPPTVAHGVVRVGITGEDKGSGIAKVQLMIDGQEQATVEDENGGKCKTPYKYLQPCKLTVPASFELDTTKLQDGQHDLKFVITDASGLTKETPATTFLVHNAPFSLARPTIEGPARIGLPLKATTGRWENSPTGFGYQWFRCPASVRGEGSDVKACHSIPGANGPQYTPVPEDVGQRDLVQVTAVNATGSEPSISLPTDLVQEALPPPPPPGKKKPVLSHVTLSRKRFRVGRMLSKGARGAVLAFSCNKPGHLSIAIERVHPGKKKPTTVGKLAAAIKAGRSKILLTGEVGTRRLAPGAYQVTIQVKGASGTLSEPATVPFAILPG